MTTAAQAQAAFRQKMKDEGFRPVTIWIKDDGYQLLKPYGDRERGEVITRALELFSTTSNTTGNITSNAEKELRQAVADILRRLEAIETAAGTAGHQGIIHTQQPTPSPTATLEPEAEPAETEELSEDMPSLPATPLKAINAERAKVPAEDMPAKARIPAEAIEMTQRMRIEGKAWNAIANELNRQGIPTPTGRGEWRNSNLARDMRKAGIE